jgi:hypothetical protein
MILLFLTIYSTLGGLQKSFSLLIKVGLFLLFSQLFIEVCKLPLSDFAVSFRINFDRIRRKQRLFKS